MTFIVFDLEFNQDIATLQNFERHGNTYPFEIIQIGALALDSSLNTIGQFNRYVKPTFYGGLNPFVSELTGITFQELEQGESFPVVYKDFIEFIESMTRLSSPAWLEDSASNMDSPHLQQGANPSLTKGSSKVNHEQEAVFCTWGMTDIIGLFRNVAYHKLNTGLLTRKVIDLQLYISMQFNHSKKNVLRLQHAVELLNIPLSEPFHNALNDAYYTAELLKKVYTPAIQPKIYDPTQKVQRPRAPRIVVDYERLIQQFEKMYARKITLEEQGMIKLAYKMGRTQQFTKEVPPASKPTPKNHS